MAYWNVTVPVSSMRRLRWLSSFVGVLLFMPANGAQAIEGYSDPLNPHAFDDGSFIPETPFVK
jgi:hypothetical protein